MNRENFITRNAAQLAFAAAIIVALLSTYGHSITAPQPVGGGQPLTIATANGSLGGYGRLFAYHPPADPNVGVCTADNAADCAQVALRERGDARTRALVALMQVDYGVGKREQGNLLLRFNRETGQTTLDNFNAFTSGNLVPGADQGDGGLTVVGRYLYAGALSIYLSTLTDDPAERANLLRLARRKLTETLVANINDPNNRLNAGVLELVAGNNAVALEHLTVANRVSNAALRPRTSLLLAMAQLANNLPQQAAATLSGTYELTRSDLRANAEAAADAAIRTGDANTALNLYNGLLIQQSYPDWQLYDKYLGAILATGRYQQGIDALTFLLGNRREATSQAKLYNDIAGLKLLAGRGTEALADYDRALRQLPSDNTNQPTQTAKAQAYQLLGQAKNAADYTSPRDRLSFKDYVDSWVIHSIVRPDRDAGLQNEPFASGVIQQAAGKSTEAAQLYQQVLQGNDRQQAAAAYTNLTAIYLANKQPQDAVNLFSSGLYDVSKPISDAVPFHPYVAAAAAFEQAGQPDRAEAAYQRALEAIEAGQRAITGTATISTAFNLDSNPQMQRGYVYASWADALNRAGRADEAIYHYRQALADWPLAYAAWYNLGQLYQKRGQNELATAALTKAAFLAPDVPLVAQSRARTAFDQGDYISGDILSHRLVAANNNQPRTTAQLDSTAGFRPLVGSGLTATPTQGGGLNPAYIAAALMLLLMFLFSLSFFRGSKERGIKGLVWVMAAALSGLLIFLLGPNPVGTTTPNLLSAITSGQATELFSFTQPLYPLLVYLLTALLTAALVYGVGGLIQKRVAESMGLVAEHRFSPLQAGIGLATTVGAGFFFGSPQRLAISDPTLDQAVAAEQPTVPSRRERVGNRRTASAEIAQLEQQRQAEIRADRARRQAWPGLVSLLFVFVVAAVFLALYLTTGLSAFRLATLVAAAYLAGNVISGFDTKGEHIWSWNALLWLGLALVAAALYGGLIFGLF